MRIDVTGSGDRVRRGRGRWARTAACLVGALAAVAWAQPTRAPEPEAWRALSPAERALLAPWQPHWERLGERQRAQLLDNVRLWNSLNPEQQDRLRARLAQWRALTSAERARLRQRHDAYLALPEDERTRVRAAFERFQALPPDRRQALREAFAALPPDQRRAWVLGAHAGELATLAREVFAFVPATQREATIGMLRGLDDEERAALRRLAARSPPWRRDELRTELLALDADLRGAYLARRLQR